MLYQLTGVALGHRKHPAHSCVVGCKQGGGALPTVTALTAQGMTIMRVFVVQVIVATTHGDTQDSEKKQEKKHIESHTFMRQKLSVALGSS